jgi:transcriptional regulator with XRE-family HTH domain
MNARPASQECVYGKRDRANPDKPQGDPRRRPPAPKSRDPVRRGVPPDEASNGVSQAAVARAIGVDRAAICRLEAGDASVSVRIRARAASVLGGDFRLGLYAAAAPLIHDAAHARLVETLLQLRHPSWRARVEAPVPGPGRRSTDLRLDRGDETVLLEVETHVHALEAIIREGEDKREAVAASIDQRRRIYVTLVLPPTRHHRALVHAHPEIIGAAFPAASSDIRRAVTTVGVAWPGDGILWLGASRRGAHDVAAGRTAGTEAGHG